MKTIYFKAINKKTGFCENDVNSFMCRDSSLKKLREKALFFKRLYNLNTIYTDFEVYEVNEKTGDIILRKFRF